MEKFNGQPVPADLNKIKRALAKHFHPDNGGDANKWHEFMAARDQSDAGNPDKIIAMHSAMLDEKYNAAQSVYNNRGKAVQGKLPKGGKIDIRI